MQKTITKRKRNNKNHVSTLENEFLLFNALIIVTTVFEDSFPNFNVVHKADYVHHSSFMNIVAKEEMQEKRQLL